MRGKPFHSSDPPPGGGDFLLLNGSPMEPKVIVIEERTLIDVYGALCPGPVNGLQNWGQAEETTRGNRLDRVG